MSDILVGDDERAFLDFLKVHLSTMGHTVRTAPDGVSVLEEIRTKIPDLVVLDLKMPKMNGEEVVNRLKSVAPGLRVILISAMRMPALLEEDDEDNIALYLKKPLNLDELDWAISHTLRQQEKSDRQR